MKNHRSSLHTSSLLYTQFANLCSRTFHVDLVVLQNCKPRGQGLCFLFPFYLQALEQCLVQGGMPEELQNWQGRWCRTTACLILKRQRQKNQEPTSIHSELKLAWAISNPALKTRGKLSRETEYTLTAGGGEGQSGTEVKLILSPFLGCSSFLLPQRLGLHAYFPTKLCDRIQFASD